MKSIRISDEAYEFLKFKAKIEKRSLIKTLDLFIGIFQEVEDEKEMAAESISQSTKSKNSLAREKLVKNKKKSI